ncbi:MAG: hypothetical protein M5U26_02015 [Planctomycetota bacterium]|nr:hypothetical protein [Planctomycetota bacterium]
MSFRSQVFRLTGPALLSVAALLPGGARGGEDDLPARVQAGIRQAVEALLERQAESGGFPSAAYGALKDGQALTPFVLETLSRLPVEERRLHAEPFARAIAFVRASVGPDGAVGAAGEVREYPVYATALAVRAWMRLKPEGGGAEVARWVAYLESAQHAEANGSQPGEPAYGGWGPQGKPGPALPRHADLSATRHVLQALEAAGLPRANPAWERALSFQARCRAKEPGAAQRWLGAYFSPTQPESNKAGAYEAQPGAPPAFRPYGTATLDGWLSWRLALGEEEFKARAERIETRLVRQALEEAASSLHAAPGFEDLVPDVQAWGKALSGYHLNALAEADAAGALDLDRSAWKRLAERTLETQGRNGLWANESNLMKEDDPLIATPLALGVLLRARERLGRK